MLSRALAFVISSLSLCLLLAPSRADAQCGSLTNDCCLPSPTLSPGCSDETCCEAVCAADAYCCDIYWDSVCAFSAALRCPSLCGNASCDLAVSNQTELELCGEGLNDDCFAIGYGIRSYGCEAKVMTYNLGAQQYADCLAKAMEMMREAALAQAP